MERKIDCNVLTPQGIIYRGELDFAVIPAYDGEMGFLFNHAPLVTQLGFGELRLKNGQDTYYLVIEDGFVEISDNKLNIIASKAIKKEDLILDDIKNKIKELEARKKEARFDEKQRTEIDNELAMYKSRLKVAAK